MVRAGLHPLVCRAGGPDPAGSRPAGAAPQTLTPQTLASQTLASQTLAPLAGPSAAMVDLRDRCEAGILAVEDNYPNDPTGFQKAALSISQRVYGSNWSVLRAETQRSLAALPEIDLAPYAALNPPGGPIPPADLGSMLNQIMPYLEPASYAMMRFGDASAVGSYVATLAVRLNMDKESPSMLGLKLALTPTRTYRARFNNAGVLATRYLRSMVITPYGLNAEGLIVPEFERVRVYPLQH